MTRPLGLRRAVAGLPGGAGQAPDPCDSKMVDLIADLRDKGGEIWNRGPLPVPVPAGSGCGLEPPAAAKPNRI